MKNDNKKPGSNLGNRHPGGQAPIHRTESATQGDARHEREPGDDHDHKNLSSGSTSKSNREDNNLPDPQQQQNGNSPQPGRGYQDMNRRSQEQDFNKNLDEDNMEHYGSQSGFEEFDEYADENDSFEGMDAEYNSRYNDDRQEDNEKEELHTDTEVSMELEEGEDTPGKTGNTGKEAAIEKQSTPYSQTESEGDHTDLSSNITTNRSTTKDNTGKEKEKDGDNRPGAKKGKR